VGPLPRYAEVYAHPNARVLVCKPCAEVRGVRADMLVPGCVMAGMNDFHLEAARSDSKVVAF